MDSSLSSNYEAILRDRQSPTEESRRYARCCRHHTRTVLGRQSKLVSNRNQENYSSRLVASMHDGKVVWKEIVFIMTHQLAGHRFALIFGVVSGYPCAAQQTDNVRGGFVWQVYALENAQLRSARPAIQHFRRPIGCKGKGITATVVLSTAESKASHA